MCSRVTRSITRRDTDPCPLAHLPPELLPVIWEHSNATDLACWALTNGHWARAMAPALTTFWKKHTSMTAALENATSFEELEAVGKISACFNLQPVHDSISIDTFRLQASFAELQQKVSAAEEAGERYIYHWCRMDVKDVDASDAAARLAAAKKMFRIQSHVWSSDKYGRSHEDRLAIATTVRLRPPELMELAESWLTTASAGADSPAVWLPNLVGAALGKNLHRTKIDNRKIAELLPMAIEIVDDPSTAAQAVETVTNWLPSERQLRLARLVRPMNEPANALFWFEFLFCDLSDECPLFNLGGNRNFLRASETICEAIDANVLAKLIEITVEAEHDEFESIAQYGGWGGDTPGAAEIHELTVDLLRGWVAARNFPAEPLSPGDQAAFLGILTSLNDDIKGLLSRDALGWVLACSRLATAKLICNALA